MRKMSMLLCVLSLCLTAAAHAADGGQQKPGPGGQNFEERKAEVLKMLDMRIAHLQEAKACVQSATTKTCPSPPATPMQGTRG